MGKIKTVLDPARSALWDFGTFPINQDSIFIAIHKNLLHFAHINVGSCLIMMLCQVEKPWLWSLYPTLGSYWIELFDFLFLVVWIRKRSIDLGIRYLAKKEKVTYFYIFMHILAYRDKLLCLIVNSKASHVSNLQTTKVVDNINNFMSFRNAYLFVFDWVLL